MVDLVYMLKGLADQSVEITGLNLGHIVIGGLIIIVLVKLVLWHQVGLHKSLVNPLPSKNEDNNVFSGHSISIHTVISITINV